MSKRSRIDFEAWHKTLDGYPLAGQYLQVMWQAWQAREIQVEALRALAAELAAELEALLDPMPGADDAIEQARHDAVCATLSRYHQLFPQEQGK